MLAVLELVSYSLFTYFFCFHLFRSLSLFLLIVIIIISIFYLFLIRTSVPQKKPCFSYIYTTDTPKTQYICPSSCGIARGMSGSYHKYANILEDIGVHQILAYF